MADFFWFSDAQWARIAPLLPGGTRGRERVDDRRVLSGTVHALKHGGRWADCPRDVYGPKKTLYNRFVRWAERGVWEGIFSALAGAADAPDRLFIDSSRIKVHRCAGGGKGGRWLMVSAVPGAAATSSSTRSATRRAVVRADPGDGREVSEAGQLGDGEPGPRIRPRQLDHVQERY